MQRCLELFHEPFSNFMRAQATAGVFLLIATITALWWANSAYALAYQQLVNTPIGFFIGDFELRASFKHIINDGLMVIFFLLLGLEIKREVLAGELASPEHRRMLILCAMGGMIAPAVIYSIFNWSLDSQIGWAIPMATDTAFALGVLSLVRKYIPISLIVFIVGFAIVDDVGAIVVIALFYTQQISMVYLLVTIALTVMLILANYAGVRQPLFYIIAGIATWWAMLQSGVHATVAGVVIAFTVPAKPKLATEKLLGNAKSIISSIQKNTEDIDVLASKNDHKKVLAISELSEHANTPLRRWENTLHLPVAIFILPLFALINAGVVFSENSFIDSLTQPVGLGIILGLVVGKVLGISGACWLGLRYRIGCLPNDITFKHVIGASLIAGIGFTMSTFIASLGFDGQPEHLHNAKTSILVASGLSALLGILYFRITAISIKEKK
ncbi:Na+/H+ antiporter NhaA [Colwellia sp. BRX8-9]|uniref:Na+/H+ antiporter NhaA n=1 Tax=Colwellia sp. BRX8-9 TaxID=2759831 RepID=UPI0021756B1D|nr:Na+/H+ antiporter NhaA [Colwellia sp. BRX8-9]